MKDTIKISENKKYYYAGFSFGGNDSQLDRFIKDGVWEGAGTKMVNDLIRKIKPNDILILKTSSTKGEKHDLPFIRIYAIGVVKSKPKQLENSKHFICDVFYTKMRTTDFDGKKYGKYRQTMHKCNDIEVIDFVNNIIGQNMIPEEIQQHTKLLKLKQNIILQGAPGTGKTYNTAALALSICGVNDVDLNDHKAVMERYEQMRYDKEKNPTGQIGFCTFHQSMDYEDFVEGIKPINTENGELYYKPEDGIFKSLSKIATNPQIARQTKSLDAAFDDLIQDILDGKIKTIRLKNGDKSKELSVSSQMTIKWKTNDDRIDANCVSKERLLKLCELYNTKKALDSMNNINESIRNIIGGCNSSYYWAIANYLLGKIGEEKSYVESNKNYVLIIDEINRGNVSKIFGELITLLEADKRIGSDHPIKVTLPYSKESFGVPSNLYIIGTMNTTDRSVGNIDYAVRRRFAFVTLESKEEVIEQYYKNDKAMKNKALELFNSVKSFLIKHKYEMDIADLMVGHSYFLAKDEEELILKWKYEIIPLLHEYYKDGILKQDIEADTEIDIFCNSK